MDKLPEVIGQLLKGSLSPESTAEVLQRICIFRDMTYEASRRVVDAHFRLRDICQSLLEVCKEVVRNEKSPDAALREMWDIKFDAEDQYYLFLTPVRVLLDNLNFDLENVLAAIDPSRCTTAENELSRSSSDEQIPFPGRNGSGDTPVQNNGSQDEKQP